IGRESGAGVEHGKSIRRGRCSFASSQAFDVIGIDRQFVVQVVYDASDRGGLVGVVVIDAITRYSRIACGFDTLPAGAQRYQKTIVKKAQGVGYRQALSTDFFGDSRIREITTGEGHGRWQRGAERVIEVADHR